MLGRELHVNVVKQAGSSNFNPNLPIGINDSKQLSKHSEPSETVVKVRYTASADQATPSPRLPAKTPR